MQDHEAPPERETMDKEEIRLEDGRTLTYYRFRPRVEAKQEGESR